MKKTFTRIISVVLCFVMLFGISASAAYTPDEMTQSLAKWLPKNITVAQAEGGIDSYLDWTVFAMARNGYTDYNKDYKAYIGKAVSEGKDRFYLSDYARITLSTLSVGLDPTDIGGVNLVEKIEKADLSNEAYTGSLAYALVALKAAGSKDDKAMTALKDAILKAQRTDGGWNSYLEASDAMYWTIDGETDSTGIALQALAYYMDDAAVKTAVKNAIEFIKKNQMSDGGFGAWGSGSAESTSMILIGLIAIGEDVDSYKVEGKTMVDALSAYINEDGGARCYDGTSNVMTSYQMLMGLSAYTRAKNGKIGLFDMSCLSPNCNSIEHNGLFKAVPALGKVFCKMVAFICSIFKMNYYCCVENY